MRFPFPERFKWKNVLTYAVLLFVGELATGTDVRFAGLVMLFVLLFAGAFNQAGGLFYPSGAYIFFNGLLILLLGITYKVFLLQPGESHLLAPLTSLMVYCGGMASMWLAVAVAKRLTPRKGLLSSLISEQTMMQSAIGCLVLGMVLLLAFGSAAQEGGSFGAAINQINRFPQFAIILATVYEIRVSNGRRAWNWVVITQVVILFTYGVIFTSKEAMFVGPATWLITAAAARFDFKPKLILSGLLFSFFMLYYMVPYSQYVRGYRDKEGSRVANQAIALEYFFRLNQVRELYVETDVAENYEKSPHLFNTSQGIMDRLTALSMDDALIARTNDGFVFGLYPVYHSFINLVPHFLWPSKPYFFVGNEYGRELAIISPDDTTTGISFSPEADSYHEAKWFGIFVVLPLVCFLYFFSNDSIVGSTRDSPWPLLLIILASHLAPEGEMNAIVLQTVEGSLGILFMAFVIRYILPPIVRLVGGRERTVVRRTMEFRPGAQPLRGPEAGEAAAVSSTHL